MPRDKGKFQISGEKTYDVKEVAAILNRTPITIYKYIHKGKMKATRIGNNFFITESNLKDFAKNHNLVINNQKILVFKSNVSYFRSIDKFTVVY